MRAAPRPRSRSQESPLSRRSSRPRLAVVHREGAGRSAATPVRFYNWSEGPFRAKLCFFWPRDLVPPKGSREAAAVALHGSHSPRDGGPSPRLEVEAPLTLVASLIETAIAGTPPAAQAAKRLLTDMQRAFFQTREEGTQLSGLRNLLPLEMRPLESYPVPTAQYSPTVLEEEKLLQEAMDIRAGALPGAFAKWIRKNTAFSPVLRAAALLSPWEFPAFPEHIRDDPVVALCALRAAPGSKNAIYVGKSLLSRRDFVMAASQLNNGGLLLGRTGFASDREVVLTAVEKEPNALSAASENLQADPKFVLEAVRRNPWAMGHAVKFKDDKNFVASAADVDPWNINLASTRLRQDAAFARLMMERHPDSFTFEHDILETRRRPPTSPPLP